MERASGNKTVTVFGPSMGNTPAAIAVRLARGEPADLLIMADQALSHLIRQGKVRIESRTELARSRIGMVVRAGAPKPDIGSVAAFKGTACREDRLFRQRERHLHLNGAV